MNRFVRYVAPRCDSLVYNASAGALGASVALFLEEVRANAGERRRGVSFMIVVIFGENTEDVVSAIAAALPAVIDPREPASTSAPTRALFASA